jgi:starch-binding outer membrane protein, SusD/RagB family
MKTVSRQALLVASSLLFVTPALQSCKDFLEDAAAPQGTLDEATLANKAGVEGTLIAAYRNLDWNNGVGGAWGTAASNWVWGSVPSDDAYKGSEASDQPPINDIEAYFWSTANAEDYLNDKWRGVYEGVVRSNATIRLLKQVVADAPGEIPAADAASIEGEALFLRAHYHFEGWRMWGNIPYYKETDTDFRKANNTNATTGSSEVVTAILADLDAAIALLPVTPRNVGRASRWTAKAYKGRVQVYDGQFAAALVTLREVQTSGPYALEASFDRVWTGFDAFDNGPETILAYQASANDGEPSGNNANYGERLNFPHSGSYFGCCGFHQPSQNLVNFYAVDGAGLPLAISSPTTWNTNNANFTGGALAPAVDPRLDWTVGRDNVPYKDWGIHEADWIRSPSYGGLYSPKKNAHEQASGAESKVGWVPSQLNSVNIHIFRYADMLLLLAEAEVEAGSLTNAMTIVNQIRTRAGQRAQGCGFAATNNNVATAFPQCAGDTRIAVPINDASITWATYRVNPYPAAQFATQALARTAVRYERRLELAMEGQRFFDLRRWGTAETELNAYLNGIGGGNEKARRAHLSAPGIAFAPRHRYYPIPAIQIELSKVGGTARLTQNPGW